MVEYVSFDPDVEFKGSTALMSIAVLEQMGKDTVPILQKYELYDIDPDGWYPLQRYLDMFKELQEVHLISLVEIGMDIPEIAEFPPIHNLDEAMNLLNTAYHMNHRGGDIGAYEWIKTGDRSGKIIARNPYPSDFDFGLIYRLVQLYRPEDSEEIMVMLDLDAPTRKTGADSCTYLISW